MLNSLFIKNFALIEEIEIDFSDKFNVIIGETGSGKSIVLDALMIALGNRAETDLIRNGEPKAIVEATFTINDEINEFIKNNDLDISELLILRREINLKGNTRNFINDTPVNANIIKQLGSLLVDFHGQSDNRILLNKNNHLKLVDLFANNYQLRQEYKLKYKELIDSIKYYNDLISKKDFNLELYENNQKEFNEILEINPNPEEINKLNEELYILENAEVIFNLTKELLTLADNDNDNLISKIKEIQKINMAISKIDKSFDSFKSELSQTIISLKEVISFYNSYNQDIDFDLDKTEKLRARLNQLKYLEKRYGSIEKAINRKDELSEKVKLVENYDFKIQKLSKKIDNIKIELLDLAKNLSQTRIEKRLELISKIEETLRETGMENAKFDLGISRTSGEDNSFKINDFYITHYGIDNIEFLISTNRGEEIKPLISVASGGEISRVMLAIKNVFAEYDNIPTLIFDEIDTGISGRISQKVGQIMKKISLNRQMIAITHLPQIAALSDNTILVSKTETDTTTTISSKVLNKDEKIIEIAKLLSGESLSESSINAAKELML